MDIHTSHDGTILKQEPYISLKSDGESHVKADPELSLVSPGLSWEDDVYEDAGDVDFDQSIQDVYLLRIPKYLWKTWSQMDDDQEIHVGTVRAETQSGVIKRVRSLGPHRVNVR